MANPENLKPFTKNDPRRINKPKGAIHLSTRIQNMLNDPEFTAEHVVDGKKITFKGQPAEAIIKTAVIRATQGDKQWADWLANNGYGSKVVHSNDPENPMPEAASKTLVDAFIDKLKDESSQRKPD